MDKFFGGEDFTYAEMIHGLRQGVRELSLFPVLCGSAVNCMGSLMLLDNIVDLLPNPMEGNYHKATLPDGETEPFVVSPGGVPAAFVFKTVSDQYGKYSFVKVLSGTLTPDLPMVNARTGAAGEAGPPVRHAGQEGHRGQGAHLRRHRRHRQDGQGPDRRHAVRRPQGGGPEGAALRRALLLRGRRAQDPGPGGQDRPGPQPASTRRTPPSPSPTTPRPTRWCSPAPATCRWTCWSASSRAASTWRRS